MPGGFVQSYSHPWKKNASAGRIKLSAWQRQDIIDRLAELKIQGGKRQDIAHLERLLLKDQIANKRQNS